ncbi:sigma factor regulator FecR [Nocardioides psychrotolerans]|uniref:Glutamine--fructose-6-phosphate aminotransferase [isomerizing] n=1 Tax=Nocardioides psychrotolerans TaxID=1005945 RepID=A0A1I3PAA0_9ACTN|nr:SIS domain-containing protein [Nocardioides psychrotolerans]GEP39626.1 sigma factor regulator FecR [Nocardioides psychrotolerans]SFJ18423.1 SIS domain-containing protein [Nocardioides psychrotolerans]
MNPSAFLADLQQKPAALRALVAVLSSGDPWAGLGFAPSRVVLIGMGSSAYAASVAAARLRARGLVAVAELASSDLLPAWGEGTLVVAISAGGGSVETLDALRRVHPDATVVALTNTATSELASRCSLVVQMQAGVEEGGVACRSFQHTLVLLLALEAHLTGDSLDPLAPLVATVLASADATEHLLATEPSWLPEVTHLLDGPSGAHVVAPARRLSSAQQSALMLREGPRRAAVACEAGDWAHVDVYLTKNTDYRLLSFAGSAWDAGILEWTLSRSTVVVSVGGDLEGVSFTLRYPGDHHDDVRLLTEVVVAELVAARLWLTP